MPHGQLIIGAPGAGKTTYGLISQNLLNQIPIMQQQQQQNSTLSSNNQHASTTNYYSHTFALYINLDPANEGFGNVSADISHEFTDEMDQRRRRHGETLTNHHHGDVNLLSAHSSHQNLSTQLRIDIMDLISLSQVQKQLSLGPNGALLYCIKYIHETGLEWIRERIQELKERYGISEFYYIVDCPGQVELYTNESESLRGIVSFLQKELHITLACVNLIDAQYCVEPAKYIGALLTCLNAQISLELPHINVMSKMDLIQLSDDLDESDTKYGELNFRLRDYLNFGNMHRLLQFMPQQARFTKLNESIIELLENWNHVSFVPLNIEKKASVLNVLRHVNKANGYIFVGDVQNAVFNQSFMDKLEEEEQDVDELF